MHQETAIAALIAPSLRWLSRKAMAPLVRRVRRMKDGRLKRFLLWGD